MGADMEPEQRQGRWWLLPLILGLLAAGAALTITEFVPRLQRYYTVL